MGGAGLRRPAPDLHQLPRERGPEGLLVRRARAPLLFGMPFCSAFFGGTCLPMLLPLVFRMGALVRFEAPLPGHGSHSCTGGTDTCLGAAFFSVDSAPGF